MNDSINIYFFDLEDKGITTYLKQRIVMHVYNRMRFLGTTLKEVWKAVNLYFFKLDNPTNTCRPKSKLSMGTWGGREYNYVGD